MSNEATRRKSVVIRPSQFCDLKPLSELREADREEILASGRDPIEALKESYAASQPHVFTIFVDGEAAGIFGAAETDGCGHGVPWMLGTDRLKLIPRELVVEGRRWIEYLNAIFPFLSNYVDERNEVSIRWLKLMGFDFTGPDFTFPSGVTFRRFTRDV